MAITTLKNKVIVVTGGKGFLGSHLVEQLKKENPAKIIAPSSKDVDLRTASAAAKLFHSADIVIHLAANVGGIGYNKKNPATLFYDNLIMSTNALHEAWKAGVEKFVAIGTICAYPKFTPVPFKEKDLWNGYPEETNAPYGLAKKMQLVQAQAYREQYGFNAIYLLPVNLYGPGDNFSVESSHVIPALIKKFVEAKKHHAEQVVVWGTGKPTREFLYVEDAARGILLATKLYDKPDPVNLGASFEISIAKLAKLIQKYVGYKGEIVFDHTKPDGQPRRKLNVSRAKTEFQFLSEVTFETGLKETIAWYQKSAHT
jgi:GDP-L-fucose synthase